MSSIISDEQSDTDKNTEIIEVESILQKNRESSLISIKPIEIINFGKMERKHRKKRKKSMLLLNEPADKSAIFRQLLEKKEKNKSI